MGKFKHGYCEGKIHPLYHAWRTMKDRCYNPNQGYYKNYGGRGIGMCKDWRRYPITFIEWALNNGWEKGLFLDRRDNDGNYSPDNCRFVTRQVSNCNKRKIQSNNTSGYRGIYWRKRNKKWIAQISINGRKKHLGCFDSKRLAAISYDVEAFLTDNRPCNFILNP